MKWHISISSRIVSEQLPPRKHAPQSGLGFVLELGLGAIFLGGNCPRTFENIAEKDLLSLLALVVFPLWKHKQEYQASQ